MFFSISFQVQGQGFIPGPSLEYNFDEFDWSAFSARASVQKKIDLRNELFRYLGADFVVSGVNLAKLDLTRIKQELELYKRGIKRGLSSEEIQQAEETIRLHRDNISSIEQAILDQGFQRNVIGLDAITPQMKSAISATKKLYQGDHEIVFNLVEKTDKRLFSALGSNNEAYAKLILPQVKQYTGKMGTIAKNYYNSLGFSNYQSEWGKNNINSLVDMYSSSFTIYKCFLKNFKNPMGVHQQQLKRTIEDWYGQQSKWSATAVISAYRQQKGGINPWFAVGRLNKFKTETPLEVKTMIADFYKNDIINNPVFKDAKEDYKLGARVDALIGLKYLGVLGENEYKEELKLFERALKEGIIKQVDQHSYFGYSRPIQ